MAEHTGPRRARWLQGELTALETVERVRRLRILDAEGEARLFALLLPSRSAREIRSKLGEHSAVSASVSPALGPMSFPSSVPSSFGASGSYMTGRQRRISRDSKPAELNGALRALIRAEIGMDLTEEKEDVGNSGTSSLDAKRHALDIVFADARPGVCSASEAPAPPPARPDVVEHLDEILGFEAHSASSPFGSYRSDFSLPRSMAAKDEDDEGDDAGQRDDDIERDSKRRQIDEILANYDDNAVYDVRAHLDRILS